MILSACCSSAHQCLSQWRQGAISACLALFVCSSRSTPCTGGPDPAEAKLSGDPSRILVDAGWEQNGKETEAQKGEILKVLVRPGVVPKSPVC